MYILKIEWISFNTSTCRQFEREVCSKMLTIAVLLALLAQFDILLFHWVEKQVSEARLLENCGKRLHVSNMCEMAV